MDLIESIDLCKETGFPYHYCFSHSAFFMWLQRLLDLWQIWFTIRFRSRAIAGLIKLSEVLKMLPHGFYQFNKVGIIILELSTPNLLFTGVSFWHYRQNCTGRRDVCFIPLYIHHKNYFAKYMVLNVCPFYTYSL